MYQLKVALRGISPLIWRRFLVHADTSIADLHHILQLAMGWTNSHLHRFLIHGQEYGITYDGGMGFDDDPRHIRLADFRFRLREPFLYEYDFNDNWQHDIRVEQIVAADPKRTYPLCIGGRRAAPPEECGGVVEVAVAGAGFGCTGARGIGGGVGCATGTTGLAARLRTTTAGRAKRKSLLDAMRVSFLPILPSASLSSLW